MSDQNNTFDPAAGEPDDYRDQGLAGRLNAERVPQHGPNFWADLQTKLDAEATAGSGLNGAARPTESVLFPSDDATTQMASVVDPTATLPVTAPHDSLEDTTAEPTNIISIDAGRRRSRVPMVLSAAAAVAVLAIGALALLARNDDATSLQTADQDGVDTSVISDEESESDPAPEEESSVDENSQAPTGQEGDEAAVSEELPELPVDYFGPATATVVGDGSLVEFSPDGSALLLLIDVTNGETGCEGAPLLELVAQNLATGQRDAALPGSATIETGGLDMRYVDPSAGGGTAYLTEYCDGFRGRTWEAEMAPNGIVSDLTEIDAEGLGDPFTTSGVPTAEAVGARELSDDLQFGAFIDGQRLTVRRLSDSGDEWAAPSEILADNVAWDPTGQVLAVTSGDGLWFWNFRTGESQLVTSPERYRDVVFDRSGTKVAVTSTDDFVLQQVSVVTFGDAAVPVPLQPVETPGPTCSDETDLTLFEVADLVALGVSEEVATTVARIDQAAATCDWEVLGELTGPDFTASFGGGDPVAIWQEAEATGGVMGTLRVLFRQPFAVDPTEAAPLHIWPAVFTRNSCDEYTDDDRQSLQSLRYSEEDIAAECDAVGSYSGYRTGFDADGNWLFFVAGD